MGLGGQGLGLGIDNFNLLPLPGMKQPAVVLMPGLQGESVSGLPLLDADGPQGARLGGVPRPHKGVHAEHAR